MAGIWIRSQDKTNLGNYNEFVIVGDGIFGYAIGESDSAILGTYATKERALQVLDEIQLCILEGIPPIYNMPAE